GFAKSSEPARTQSVAARPGLALAAAITTVSLVGVGLSLTMALLAVRLAQMGYSARAIGLNPAAGGLATLFIATHVPRFAHMIGLRTLLFVALFTGIASLTAFAFYENYWIWLFLRGVFGAALTVLFVLSEFWINVVAPPKQRGLVLGIYTTSLAAGFAAGPLILALTGTDGVLPFFAAVALFAIAAIPVVLVGSHAPELEDQADASVWSFISAAPLATCAAIVFGAVETGALGLLPVYALRNSMNAETGAVLVTLFALGNIIFPIPMGVLSDRLPRRRLLTMIAAAALIGALLLPLAEQISFVAFAILLVIWGGIVGSLYAVGLAHLGERYRGAELAAANATYILLYSVGMLLGPPVLGSGLDLAPPGLFWAMALLLAAYLGLGAWRIAASRS
ncbi:MAG TPA: MFS transporter, partial [Methylovirgula sp.]